MDWICEGIDLKGCQQSNLEFNKDAVFLKEGVLEGFLETPMIETSAFKEITPSWNATTDIHSQVTLFIKIRVNGIWTDYISYGVWSNHGHNLGISHRPDYETIRVTADRIFVIQDAFGDAVQLKVILQGVMPKLRLVAFSTDAVEKEEIHGNCYQLIPSVPKISQLISGHKDANCICSPTSLTMALHYFNVDISYFDVVSGTFDTGNKAYGNWPQNVAFAGECGLRAYTKRCTSINTVKDLISRNIPVVCSIVMKDKSQLEGAICAYPDGHLVIVVGFKMINGIEYILVNDPAANSLEDVFRTYKLSEFVSVWRKYIYHITR